MPAPDTDPPYQCSACEQPITTEAVVRIEAELEPTRPVAGAGVVPAKTGYMLITHHCPCSPLLVTSRRHGSYSAFVALFGHGISLPYDSPFNLTSVDDDDPALVRWRWELQQTADAEEFVFWLDSSSS